MAAHSGALGGRLSRAGPFAALVHINIHRISTPRSLRRAVASCGTKECTCLCGISLVPTFLVAGRTNHEHKFLRSPPYSDPLWRPANTPKLAELSPAIISTAQALAAHAQQQRNGWVEASSSPPNDLRTSSLLRVNHMAHTAQQFKDAFAAMTRTGTLSDAQAIALAAQDATNPATFQNFILNTSVSPGVQDSTGAIALIWGDITGLTPPDNATLTAQVALIQSIINAASAAGLTQQQALVRGYTAIGASLANSTFNG